MTDEYERVHMPGVGQVLFRHKVSSPRWLMALTAGLPFALGAVAGIGLAIGGDGLSGLAVVGGSAGVAALITFVNVTFSTARIAVSEGEIHVQLGFAGPKIPIAEVASVKLAPSGSNRVGMGVRSDLRGTTVFTLWGRNDRAVHIERTDGSKLVLVVKEPDAIAQAIEEAMARRDQKAPAVRVATQDADEPADEPAAEQSEAETAARAERQGKLAR